MTQLPATRIDPAQLAAAIDPNTQRVLHMLHTHHVPVRVVGGAVRDLLLGKGPRDIDLVIDADPSELLFLFDMYGIPVDTGGIQHGTIKAVFGSGRTETKVDVSSLGYRIKVQDQRPHATGTVSWERDSAMRDLSINSMSMSPDGRVWDYQGGLADLRDQRIRMLPEARQHIGSDPNLIMRYFKSLNLFSDPKLQKADLQAIAQAAPKLAKLSGDERVLKNQISIQSGPNSHRILRLMCALKLQDYLPSIPCQQI